MYEWLIWYCTVLRETHTVVAGHKVNTAASVTMLDQNQLLAFNQGSHPAKQTIWMLKI